MDAPTKAVWNEASKIWALSVKCPLCKQKVRHGGGDDPKQPLLGPRSCNACSQPINLVEKSK